MSSNSLRSRGKKTRLLSEQFGVRQDIHYNIRLAANSIMWLSTRNTNLPIKPASCLFSQKYNCFLSMKC